MTSTKNNEAKTEEIREDILEEDEEVVESDTGEATTDRVNPSEETESTGETGATGEAEAEGTPADEEEESLKDQYLRLMADFQNYKRRVEKERQDVHAFANEKIVTDLLEVMDNFERALSHEEGEGYKEGISLIFDQLKGLLTNAGVEEIVAEKETFDPNLHNAVLMEETDQVESGQVSEVMQKGYTLHGKVIRPAMVKVAK